MTQLLKPLVLMSLFLGLSLAAQAQQKLVPAQSEIVFVSKQMGVPVEGRFQKFDAQINFDPKKPQASTVAFGVDLGSVNMGAPDVQTELAKPEWFNSLKWPQAKFVSTAFKALGAGKFEIRGKLSIKGSSQDLTIPITLTQNAGSTLAVGSFVLKRADFKIGDGAWSDTSIVANEVQVKFKLSLVGVALL